MRKGTIPKGASLTTEEDEQFERLASADIDRLPASVWGGAGTRYLWRCLLAAHKSTRRRLLMQILYRCVADGCAPPAQLVKQIECELEVSTQPRARVHDLAKVKEAARFKAHNSDASLQQIATAIGIRNKTTVRSFMKRPEFDRFLKDEQFLIEHERRRQHELGKCRVRSSKKEMLNGG